MTPAEEAEVLIAVRLYKQGNDYRAGRKLVDFTHEQRAEYMRRTVWVRSERRSER